MDFEILGPLRVSVDGAEAVVGSVRQRTLLAALLVAGGSVVSADRLAEIIWGHGQPQDAGQALQTHVSRLRGVLDKAAGGGGRGVLATRFPGYALLVDAGQVDAGRFERLADRVRAAGTPAEVVDLADRALALWRGPPLMEFDQVFARLEAARLEERRLGLVEDRAEALLALGRSGEVVADLEPLATEHPLREQLHGRLMLGLYRCGRQAEALAVYRRLRDRLVEELGVEPSPALRGLEQDILQQRENLASPPTLVPPSVPVVGDGSGDDQGAPPDAAVPRLPAEVTSFVGRRDDVAGVAAALERARLVTLTGLGGVGKTRLALRVAHQLAARFGDGVWLCDLAAVEDPATVADVVAATLGVRPKGSSSAADALVAHLDGRRLLLVVDNCEHVLDAAGGLIDRLVGACRHARVLATSRQPLRVAGEQAWPVQPLPVGADADATRAPAVELFCDRAIAADPGFTLGDDQEAVVEICRTLDGLPLAIELAAGRVRSMTPVDIAERLDRRFELLTSGLRTGHPRHRSLQAVVEFSYALLSEPARRLFDRLAVFMGGFTLDAAEGVCADGELLEAEVAGRLGELVDHSLVVVGRDGGHGRYRLLETLRMYGEARLDERGELATWRRRHVDHLLDLAEQAEVGARGFQEPRWVAVLDAELANLRAAHRWAVVAADVDVALRLPALLHFYAYYRLRDEVFRWAEQAVALPGAPAQPWYAQALVTAAAGCVQRGELDRATGYADQARRAMPAAADVARMRALELMADVAIYRGQLDDVDRWAQDVIAVARSLGSPFDEALGHLYSVFAAAYTGRTDEAMVRLEQGRQVADATANPSMRASYRMLEGEVLLETEPERAEAALDEAIDIARSVNNRFVEGVARVSVASVQARRAEAGRALATFAAIIHDWRQAGDWTHQWTTLRNLLVLLVRLGAQEPAAVLHGAIESASTGAPAFGADAERLAATAASVRSTLGPERFAAASARGHAMEDHEVVAYALDVVDRLRSHRWSRSS